MAKSGPKSIFLMKIGAGGAEIFWLSEMLERGPGSSGGGGVCRAVRGGVPQRDLGGGGAAGLSKAGAHLWDICTFGPWDPWPKYIFGNLTGTPIIFVELTVIIWFSSLCLRLLLRHLLYTVVVKYSSSSCFLQFCWSYSVLYCKWPRNGEAWRRNKSGQVNKSKLYFSFFHQEKNP